MRFYDVVKIWAVVLVIVMSGAGYLEMLLNGTNEAKEEEENES